MKKFSKGLGILFLCLLMTWVGFRTVQAVTYTKPNYQKQHWDVALNAVITAIQTDVTTLYTNVASLGNIVANWVGSIDTPVLINTTPVFVNDHTITLAGDYSSLLTVGRRIIIDNGQDPAVGNTVVSATYAAPNTTLVVTFNNITSNVQAISYYATRNGTPTAGSGDIVAGDYGTPSWSVLQTAIGLANSTGRRLVVTPGTWPISGNITVTAPLYMAATAQFQVAPTKTLTQNGYFGDTGAYQVFSATSSVVFGPGAVQYILSEWFGSIPDGTIECSTGLQAAFNCANASTSGAGTVKLLDGRYRITTALTVPTFVSIVGVSPDKSKIEPDGCDGLVFVQSIGSTSLGPKVLRDFTITGTSCGPYSGISCALPASQSYKVEGLDISKLRISGFGWAIKMIGAWNWRIHKNYLYGNDVGIAVLGKSVSNIISKNNIEYAAVAGSAGTSTCLIINSETYGDASNPFPEMTDIMGNQFYGGNKHIVHTTGTQVYIHGCNKFDQYLRYGILINGGSNSGFDIINNWFLAGNSGGVSPCYAIRNTGTPAGGPFKGKNVVAYNKISGQTPVANQYGISLENNAYMWLVQGNTVWDHSVRDFQIVGAPTAFGQIDVLNNDFRSGGTVLVQGTAAASTTNLDGNKSAGPIHVHGTNSGMINIGKNNGTYSTYVRGYTTIPSGNTTATSTFASMPVFWPDFANPATYGIYPLPRINSYDDVDLGHVRIVATVSNVTVTCTIAPGADKKIYWEVLGYTLKDLGL